jgi:serine/threonine protein kinase
MTFFVIAAIAVPITIASSIRQNRLWKIDFLISRSLVYGAVTGLLGLMFVGIIILLEQVFEKMTGGEQSALAVAASALAVAGIFRPVRNGLRRMIDYRLYGLQINYGNKPHPAFQGFSLEDTSIDIGPYKIDSPIKKGGMSEIYKGRHINSDREVAIKILPPTLAATGDFRKRFEREARTVASLKHPSIVQVYDFGETNGFHYMVMEYISGNNLAEHIEMYGPLKIPEAQSLLDQIAKAIDYAHQAGVIHRDIKPSNIMMRPIKASIQDKFRPILTDFGVAKILTGETRITQTGIVGTFDFIAPEQIEASGRIDERADIYSLGVLGYQLLTGYLPFYSNNLAATLMAHLQQPPPDPRILRPDLTDSQAGAILKALEKSPENRFQTALSFSDALA